MNNGIEAGNAPSAGVQQSQVLRAEKDGCWVELMLEYTFGVDGQLCANAMKYRVSENGREKGNLWLGIEALESWGEELTSSAIQDGQWHVINGGACVNSSGFGKLILRYLYDRAGAADLHMENVVVVKSL